MEQDDVAQVLGQAAYGVLQPRIGTGDVLDGRESGERAALPCFSAPPVTGQVGDDAVGVGPWLAQQAPPGADAGERLLGELVTEVRIARQVPAVAGQVTERRGVEVREAVLHLDAPR